MVDPLSIGALLAGLGVAFGWFADLAAAGVNLISAFISNFDKIVMIYIVVGWVTSVALNVDNTHPFIKPFELFIDLELHLLTPPTSIESLSPIYYDLELIINPFAMFGGESEYNVQLAAETDEKVKSNMEEAVENMQGQINAMSEKIMPIFFVMVYVTKLVLFLRLNYDIIMAIFSWYGVTHVADPSG